MIIYRVDLSESYSGVCYTFKNGNEALAFAETAMEHCSRDQRYTIHIEHIEQEEEKETTEE